MSRNCFALSTAIFSTAIFIGFAAIIGMALADVPAAATGKLAIVDFSYIDSSQEQLDQSAAHKKRVETLMIALRQDIVAGGQFNLVPVSCGAAPCATDSTTPEDLLRSVSDAGANILIVGSIHKQSTLIQWMKVSAIDVSANRVILDRLFTFRGDNDEAWRRAEAFVSQEIRTVLAAR